MSTTAIKDGHQGHAPHHAHGHAHNASSGSDSSTNTLDAERADRISRLAGLERVATVRGATSHLASGMVSVMPPQASGLGYFDHAAPPSGKERSTVGSASATGSIGGRTTWASGSDIPDADKMSEDGGNSSSGGLSDEGNASLVGFGEGASSTVSGPISPSARMHSSSRTVGLSGSLTTGRQGTWAPGLPLQGAHTEDTTMVDVTSDRDTPEITPRKLAEVEHNKHMAREVPNSAEYERGDSSGS